MSLYRANDRLPEDESFLCIRNPDELVLFRERDTHGIRGIIYTEFDVTEELKRAAIGYGRYAIQNGIGFFGSKEKASIRLHPKFNENGELTGDRLRKEFEKFQIPELLQSAIELVIKNGHIATNIAEPETYFRVNTNFPASYHPHEPGNHTVSISFNHAGTEIKTLDGGSVTLQPRQLGVIESQVQHRAGKPTKNELQVSPRIVVC